MTQVRIYLDHLQSLAQERWGDRWQARLIDAYVEQLHRSGDVEATSDKRRSTIYNIFRNGVCTLEILLLLAAALDCHFELVHTKTERFRG